MSDDDTGVLYLAFGYEYLVQAVLSFRSLRNHHPNLPVSIITNINIADENPGGVFEDVRYFDKVISVDAKNEVNRHYKTSLVKYTPYEKTMYIDSDTYIEDKLKTGFGYVGDSFQLALRPVEFPLGPGHHHFDGLNVEIAGLPLHEHTYYNTGVVFFSDSERTRSFFHRWNRLYHELDHPYDAISFLRTTFETDIPIYPLNQTWNKNKQGEINSRSLERLRVYHYIEPHRNADILDEIRQIESNIPDAFFKDTSTETLERWRVSTWEPQDNRTYLSRLLHRVTRR